MNEQENPETEEYRPQLMRLAERRLSPMLRRLMGAEDVVQETLAAACRKQEFMTTHPEVPVYCKLRLLLLQTLADAERRYLKEQKRDVCRELNGGEEERQWEQLAASAPGPFTGLARWERAEALRAAVAALSPNDRAIIELNCFDGMTYEQCAAVLHITPNAAGLRYLRALQRLRRELEKHSLFRP